MSPVRFRPARVGLACLALVSCRAGDRAPAPRQFTDVQMKANFAWDLGHEVVDVSAYPPGIQASYRVFLGACSRCHTTARALNAPIVTRDQWWRYVRRMHMRSQERALTAATARAIVEFLAHDAAVRKVGRQDAYLNEVKRLQDMYADLEVERARVRLEEGLRAGKDRGYVSP